MVALVRPACERIGGWRPLGASGRADADPVSWTGMLVTRVEAPESRSLPALLAPGLRSAMIGLERRSQGRELARRAYGVSPDSPGPSR